MPRPAMDSDSRVVSYKRMLLTSAISAGHASASFQAQHGGRAMCSLLGLPLSDTQPL
jgi:hypothetical protein